MEHVISDKAGRRLALRRVGVLERLRLCKALGGELAGNAAYMGYAAVAAAVSMIDDVPVPFPVNEAGLEALLDRLGEDGVGAVAAAVTPAPVDEMVAEAGN